jgi:hypothetical protein
VDHQPQWANGEHIQVFEIIASIQKTDIVTFHEKRNQSQRRHNLAAFWASLSSKLRLDPGSMYPPHSHE